MKVLMIGAGRDVQGGVSTVVNQYYEAHLDDKIELKYIATMRDGSKIKKFFVAAKAYLKFKRCVKNYQIVHVHMASRASFFRKSYFIKLAHKYGKKIIIHMHGAEFDGFYNNECNEKQKKQIRDIFALADAVIALSEEWKEFFDKICNQEKITVLYNAVKMPDFIRTDYNDKNVLFLGRLGKRKGVYDLIEAMPFVIKKIPQVHFYLGGDGEVEECKKRCLELGVQEHVTYLGWVKDDKKIEMLKKCSTFVLPSYHEGMPMSLLEAMSYGDVVVSSTVGGIPKVIKNGENGYLIEAGNQAELSDAIVKALTSSNRKSLGIAAYKTIFDKFNIDRNVEQLVYIYKGLTV